jgi:hypothetical protein
MIWLPFGCCLPALGSFIAFFLFCWFLVVFPFFLFVFVFRSYVASILCAYSPPTIHCWAFSRVPTAISFQRPFRFRLPTCARSTCAFSAFFFFFYVFPYIVGFLWLYLWFSCFSLYCFISLICWHVIRLSPLLLEFYCL